MFATPLTSAHVIISLVAILSGLPVLAGLLSGRLRAGGTLLFLVTTAATTLTGFLLPFTGITPAVATGIVAALVLLPTVAALYLFQLSGVWRAVYVVGAVVSLYLNVFVLVVQLFQKVPALNIFAPTGSEPPFAIVQGIVLVLFLAAGYLALRRFHPSPR